ncbi:MAG: hypothetical protein EBU97_06620 [Rhodobacteraceae bacterium]|nr:hypothetical protein [Paracoccaceae bacterium]
MPILLIVLAIGTLGYMWLARRGSSLTRLCRWRRDGAGGWRCAACGAVTQTAQGRAPKQCLNPDRGLSA